MIQKIDKLRYLQIGVQGENIANDIQIDVSEWVEAYPGASIHLLFKPYNAVAPSPMTITVEDGILTWQPSLGATVVTGVGYTEVRAIDPETGMIKKSRIIPTAVENSVSGVDSEDPPAPFEDWVNSVLQAGEDAVNAKTVATAAKEAAEAARDAAQAAAGDFQGLSAEAETLPASSNATIDVTHEEGGLYQFGFGIPKGTTFTPSVSQSGDISWTNDGGKTNPETVNIKGPQGDPAPSDQVVPAVEGWLDTHITNPSNPPLDTSLSLSNAAAPANLVGELKSAIEQTDYAISPYTGRFVVIAVHNNAYIKDTDGTLASYVNWVASDFIQCTPGTVIHIKSRNGKYNAFYTDKNESSFLQALNYGDTVVPQTAKYFRVSTQKSVYDQYGFDITTDQTGFDIALTRVEDSISTASKWQAFSNDMNNLAENKIYQIMYNDGVSNLPFSGYFGTVVTFTHSNSSESKTTVQLAFGRYGKSAWRMKWGSTWGEWNLISIEQNSIMSSLISLSSDSVWSEYNYDFDNLPINKIFQIVYTNEDEEDTEHNTKHSPVPAFRGNVITFDYDPSSASKTQVQLAFARSGKTYRRMMWGSTWESWYEFANMDDIPNVGTAYKGLGDFIACGDSNTVSLSYPTSESGIPVKSWATSLAEMIGSDCDIYAAGGRSTAGFINSDDYAPAVADTKQFAILYLGINDCSQSVEIETFTANYTTIVNALLTNHKFVFCLNIPSAVQPSSRRTQYNTAIASVCSSISKAFLVDITGCSDRITVYKNVGHLSSIGYAVLAGEIAQAINKTMSENDYFDAQIDVDSN